MKTKHPLKIPSGVQVQKNSLSINRVLVLTDGSQSRLGRGDRHGLVIRKPALLEMKSRGEKNVKMLAYKMCSIGQHMKNMVPTSRVQSHRRNCQLPQRNHMLVGKTRQSQTETSVQAVFYR